MDPVKIVTDSGAHLRPGIAARLDVSVVPQNVHLNGLVYREGVDITSKEFHRRMASGSEMPVVSAPSVNEISTLYQQLYREHDRIISLHVSSELSGTCTNARRAAQPLLGRCDIRVIDSLSISLGLGMLVEAAAQAAADGADMDGVVRVVRGMIPHVYLIIMAEALEYQEREARIRPSQAVLGAMLGIRPVLTLEEGRLVPMEKVRSRALGVEKLLDFIFEFSGIQQLAIFQSSFSEDTAALLEGLEAMFPDWDVPVFTYGPSLAARIGLGALGVAIGEKPWGAHE